MPRSGTTDQEFAAIWEQCGGSATEVAERLGITLRGVFARRRKIEKKLSTRLIGQRLWDGAVTKLNYRQIIDKIQGPVLIFSDLHAWPGDYSPAFFACLKLIKELKPRLIINNGDAFDGATISRHPPMGYLDLPSVEEELKHCQDLLRQIEGAARKGTPLIWNAGNHDNRFTARLATHAPEFARIHGCDLKDHFPAWTWGWSCVINPGTKGETMIKHRWHNGAHASYNNALKSGVNIVTGHTHHLKAVPITDYRGRRWGIETGTLSPIGLEAGDKFSYAEDNPANACQGFVILHYDKDGKMLPPELVETIEGKVYWRGSEV